MRDYLKCAARNRVTLGGYGLIVSGVGIALHMMLIKAWFAILVGCIVVYAGIGLLAETNYGRETLEVYLRTKHHIARFGRVGERYFLNLAPYYCSRVGVELAMKEADLTVEWPGKKVA